MSINGSDEPNAVIRSPRAIYPSESLAIGDSPSPSIPSFTTDEIYDLYIPSEISYSF
jgi:hypothetical protein